MTVLPDDDVSITLYTPCRSGVSAGVGLWASTSCAALPGGTIISCQEKSAQAWLSAPVKRPFNRYCLPGISVCSGPAAAPNDPGCGFESCASKASSDWSKTLLLAVGRPDVSSSRAVSRGVTGEIQIDDPVPRARMAPPPRTYALVVTSSMLFAVLSSE